MQTSTMVHNKKVNRKILKFWFPDGDPDHYLSLMGSRFDQDPSSYFFMKLEPLVFV